MKKILVNVLSGIGAIMFLFLNYVVGVSALRPLTLGENPIFVAVLASLLGLLIVSGTIGGFILFFQIIKIFITNRLN